MPMTILPASIEFPKLHLPLFDEGRFIATQFDGSADKAKFANRLLRFIGKGFPDSMFNQSFYNRLSMCFGHIAHYAEDVVMWSTWSVSRRVAALRVTKITVSLPGKAA